MWEGSYFILDFNFNEMFLNNINCLMDIVLKTVRALGATSSVLGRSSFSFCWDLDWSPVRHFNQKCGFWLEVYFFKIKFKVNAEFHRLARLLELFLHLMVQYHRNGYTEDWCIDWQLCKRSDSFIKTSDNLRKYVN